MHSMSPGYGIPSHPRVATDEEKAKLEGKFDYLPTKATLLGNSVENEVGHNNCALTTRGYNEVGGTRAVRCTGHLNKDPPSTLSL